MDFGQHIILCLQNREISPEERTLLQKLRPGGIHLRAQNFLPCAEYGDWIEHLQRFLDEIQNTVNRDKLLIAMDHEGGRVNRLPHPQVRFPYPITFRERSADVGAAMGEQLRSVGVNFCFGPVADIHVNPNNPIIGPRCFGTSADEVIESVLPFFSAIREKGITCCAKHFPGHGDTSEDTHFRLPSLDLDEEALEARELKPFRSLIEAGIPCVMTSHILFPKIDPNYPATLSQKILNGILRKKLRFDRVVVTDDLDMQAVRDRYSLKDTARLLVESEVDLMIFNHFPERAVILCEELEGYVKSQPSARSKIVQSKERITHLLSATQRSEIPYMLADSKLAAHKKLLSELPSGEEFANTTHHYEPK